MKHRQRWIRGDPSASRDRYDRRCRTSLARGFAEDGWLAGRGHVRVLGAAPRHTVLRNSAARRTAVLSPPTPSTPVVVGRRAMPGRPSVKPWLRR